MLLLEAVLCLGSNLLYSETCGGLVSEIPPWRGVSNPWARLMYGHEMPKGDAEVLV